MSKMNIIFYSKECATCFKLIQLLDSEKFLKYFNLVRVDGKFDLLPPQITAVPTMMVHNINKPLQGPDCFKWLASMIDFRDNKKNSTEDNKMDPEGFAELELGKFSDQYTVVDPQVNDPLAQAFFKYKDEKSNAIHTAPREKRISGKEQQKRIKDLEIARQQQDNRFKTDMKAEQKEIISKHKKR